MLIHKDSDLVSRNVGILVLRSNNSDCLTLTLRQPLLFYATDDGVLEIRALVQVMGFHNQALEPKP